MIATISSKGQIVLPVEIRRRDCIESGQKFEIERIEEGDGAFVSIEWAEALYEDGALMVKGHRDETVGKQFFGFGDRRHLPCVDRTQNVRHFCAA